MRLPPVPTAGQHAGGILSGRAPPNGRWYPLWLSGDGHKILERGMPAQLDANRHGTRRDPPIRIQLMKQDISS
jgi:hypothetical protein